MVAKVLSVANTKGGAGKTTTTVALADFWRRRGRRVAAVDLDPNRKLTGWLIDDEGRPRLEGVAVEAADRAGMRPAVTRLRAENDIILLDLAGVQSAEMLVAFGLSDAVLIPTGSSYGDIEEVRRTATDLVTYRDGFRDKKPDYDLPFAALLTRVDKRRGTYAAAQAQLVEFGVPLLEASLTQRVAYETAWWHLTSPLETGGKPVIDDVADVAAEILSRLGVG